MTDRDALLSAVLEQPAEDTPRLVFADHLDELGGARNAARAELIRVQCELLVTPQMHLLPAGSIVTASNSASPAILEHPMPVANRRWDELRAREEAILKRWAASFLPKRLRPRFPTSLRVEGATVVCDTAPMGGYVRFERGFVAHAGCELPLPCAEQPLGAHFGAELAAIFQAKPLTGFTVSFAGTHLTLTAAVGPQATGDGSVWVCGWDYDTQKRHADLLIGTIRARCEMRRGAMARAIAPWLCEAIRYPVAAVAARVAMEEPAEDVEEEPPDVLPFAPPQPDRFAELDAYIARLRALILEDLRQRGPWEPDRLRGAREALHAAEEERRRAEADPWPITINLNRWL